jgi:prepilin-type N-terminal cleavage/methylation domain-containing protein
MHEPNYRVRHVRRADRGFSLIELLTALVVLSVLLAFGPPAYSNWMAAQRLANEAHHFAETLQLARSEAIKHGYRVNVCKTLDRFQCTDRGDWSAGWLMSVDENHSGQVDVAELVLYKEGSAPTAFPFKPIVRSPSTFPIPAPGHAGLLSGGL